MGHRVYNNCVMGVDFIIYMRAGCAYSLVMKPLMKVLVVSPDSLSRWGVIEKFKSIHEMHEVENADQALDFLDRNKTDLVITELEMPQLTGLELTRRIKMHFPEVMVVMFGQEKLAESFFKESGGFHFLEKSQVVTQIESVVGSVQAGITARDSLRAPAVDSIPKQSEIGILQ